MHVPERVAQLCESAAEVHKIAYEVPSGIGEYALLQLSERMTAEADRRGPAATGARAESQPQG